MNYVPPFRTCDVANGDGIRVTVFVTGCRRKCKGCFNKEAQDFNYGTPFTKDTISEIIRAMNFEYITGLTILGGEPMEPENQPSVLELIEAVRKKFGNTKTIWLYSGYEVDKHLLQNGLNHIPGITPKILNSIDVIVDGPFIEAFKDPSLKFRGSSNQRILTPNIDFNPFGTTIAFK